MNKERVLILDKQRIDWKLKRMAYQVWEHNTDVHEITIIGIERAGMAVANSLGKLLNEISGLNIKLISLKMNKKEPLTDMPVIEENLDGKSIVLVDDVANSGRTLLYALKPLLNYSPSRIMIAVLVDRKHKSFPITPDIVGHAVSTTLQEQITVEHDGDDIMAAYLE